MTMSIPWLLIIVLILVLGIGVLPSWPYSSQWGYGPSGVVGLIFFILILLILMGRI